MSPLSFLAWLPITINRMRDGRKISVIFDIFDTLIKPRIPVHQQYLIVFERYGLKMSESEVKNNFKKG